MIKGDNPNTLNKKAKSPYKSGHQILILPGRFGFKLSENFNNASPRVCAASSESSLLSDATSTEISCDDPFNFRFSKHNNFVYNAVVRHRIIL